MHWHENILDIFIFHIFKHRRYSFYTWQGCRWDQQYKFYCKNLGNIWTEGTQDLKLSHFTLSMKLSSIFGGKQSLFLHLYAIYTLQSSGRSQFKLETWGYNKLWRYGQWMGTSNLSLNVFRVDHRLSILLFSANAATWFIRWSSAIWLLVKW